MTVAIIAPGKTKAVAVLSTLSTLWLSVIVVTSKPQTTAGPTTATPLRPRTQLKWLLNTGNLAGHWPPAFVSQPGCRNQNGTNTTAATNCSVSCGAAATAHPNTITRLQMIRGGGAAVLVMPTGDGGHRCCIEGVTPQFSLGLVELKHGVNNLFPIIRPFPDWRSFVDSPSERKPFGTSRNNTKETPTEQLTETPTDEPSGLPMDKHTETASDESTKMIPDEPTTITSDEPTKVAVNQLAKTASDEPTETASGESTNTASDEPTVTVTDEPTKMASDKPTKTIPNDPCKFEASNVTEPLPKVNVTTTPKDTRRHERIVNAVDAFLDERGRLLWVLDTGVAGEDACYGNMPPSGNSQSTNDSETDELLPPKFVAIDVHESEIVSVVSLARVWRPGISCFQYIVAVYPDETDEDAKTSSFTNYTTMASGDGTNSTTPGPGDGTLKSDTMSSGGETTNSDSTGSSDGPTNSDTTEKGDATTNSDTTEQGDATTKSTTAGSVRCPSWPLVVVGDAGTNRLLVYTHSIDKFTEIMLPMEGESALNEADGGGGDEVGRGINQSTKPPRKPPPKSPVRDILYLVPLYPQPGQTRLLITYYGCWDVYKLRLQPSESEQRVPSSSSAGKNRTGPGTPQPPAAVTGTLTIMGRKPCRMVLLGSDRRRTDIGDQAYFGGGGNTVFFRLENTNDVWSWDTGRKRSTAGDGWFIDQRLFRLVRPGRSCRVPVAVSAAPAAPAVIAAKNTSAGAEQESASESQQQVVQQLVWMLETNFVDHFAGTTDGMGANAKLQPIEVPLFDSGDTGDDERPTTASGPNKGRRPPPLRVQPYKENRRNPTTTSVNITLADLPDRSTTIHI